MTDKKPTGSSWIGGVQPPDELRTQSKIAIYEMECRQQPEKLAQMLSAYREVSIRKELDTFRDMARSSGSVLFIGMGASYCSSIVGASVLQLGGRSSFAVEAGEWLHYSNTWDEAAASLLLTTSGESAELVQLCRA